MIRIYGLVLVFSDLNLLLTSYGNANLGDLDILNNISAHNSFENKFIGFQDFITHITYPISLKILFLR